ncbi:hypothetical protein [Streptomyces fragilis]|nr:hypothetical protein [Streptomyces fragilis]
MRRSSSRRARAGPALPAPSGTVSPWRARSAACLLYTSRCV